MKKSVKVVALILTVVIFISLLAFAFGDFNPTPIKAKTQAEAANIDDKRIAVDISNMTGVAVEEILAIRNTGKSWNDVLDELNGGNYRQGNSINQRENLLSQSRLGEHDLELLKEEGFGDVELQQAKLLVERVVFQLQEIASGEDTIFEVNEADSLIMGKTEDLQKYLELAARFDIRKCLYLTLKLRDELGSMETVLDEYLFSLQAGIDLALYIADREEYLKQRKEKEMEPGIQDIITAADIESKMLERLGQKNDVMGTDPNNLIDPIAQKAAEDADPTINDILPDIPIPGSDGIKPENPADRIEKEIDLLDPMKTANGGIGQ